VAVIYVVLTIIVVAVIGLVSVGRVTYRMAEQPPPSLFDLDEAVDFVAEKLPFEVSARLSYDDVRLVVGWHLDYLEAKGVAAETDDAAALVELGRAGGPVVAADDEGVAYVLGRAEAAGVDIDDIEVVLVLESELAYLEAIGAIGSAVEPPLDPG
jgi:hypothetical protein